MTEPDATVMDEEEQEEFLGTGGTGVLSFSTPGNEAPHTIPVSYGYDIAEATFYSRLAVDPGSTKEELLDRVVSFVVYGSVDEIWQSVIARGEFEEITDELVATEPLHGFEHVCLPFVDIFGKPPADVQFEFYRLVPETLTGRKESPTSV